MGCHESEQKKAVLVCVATMRLALCKCMAEQHKCLCVFRESHFLKPLSRSNSNRDVGEYSYRLMLCCRALALQLHPPSNVSATRQRS